MSGNGRGPAARGTQRLWECRGGAAAVIAHPSPTPRRGVIIFTPSPMLITDTLAGSRPSFLTATRKLLPLTPYGLPALHQKNVYSGIPSNEADDGASSGLSGGLLPGQMARRMPSGKGPPTSLKGAQELRRELGAPSIYLSTYYIIY